MSDTVQWYAVRTATRREGSAFDALAEQGFTVFMPCETRWSRSKWVKEKVRRPLFVGYLFVLCAPSDFHQVLETEGVHQFVRYMVGDVLAPMPIPLAAVIEIQSEERSGRYDMTRTYRPPYKPKRGDRVKITAGVWMGFVARVLSTPTGSRAHLMIEGPHGRGTRVDVKSLEKTAA